MNVGIVTGAARGMGRACARAWSQTWSTSCSRSTATSRAWPRPRRASRRPQRLEPFRLDVKDPEGVARLATRASELGTLRAVAHAAGVSPTMADWREIVAVDLVGTALLVDALFPLASAGTAIVCFASIAPLLAMGEADLPADVVLDDPLDGAFLDRIREAVGPEIEDSGMAYTWASGACTGWSGARPCASAGWAPASARSRPA